MKKVIVWAAVIFVSASLIACRKQVSTKVLVEKDVLYSSEVKSSTKNKEGFINYLKECGYKIKISEFYGEPIMPGSITEVNITDMPNKIIEVYEYKNNDEMEQTAKTIDAEGSKIGYSYVDWKDKPHFYKGENIIVSYIGDSKEIIENIEKFMGSQFAGQK